VLPRGEHAVNCYFSDSLLQTVIACLPLQVIKIRLYGDMKAVSLDSWAGTLKIVLGILTAGLLPALFPNFIEFTLPPVCESMRRKTQRRLIPAGKYF